MTESSKRALIGGGLALFVAVVVAAALIVRASRTTDEAAEPKVAVEGVTITSAPVPAPTIADVETRFIAASADHLCRAQSQVYESPEALAAAYQAPVEVPGLAPEQVTELQGRLTADPTFSERLTVQLSETCKPGEMVAGANLGSESTTTAP